MHNNKSMAFTPSAYYFTREFKQQKLYFGCSNPIIECLRVGLYGMIKTICYNNNWNNIETFVAAKVFF